jgi:hypothetical protein
MRIPQERDVWALATMLIAKYGQHSIDAAARRAEKALENDDELGHGLWLQVADAVRELARSAEATDLVN